MKKITCLFVALFTTLTMYGADAGALTTAIAAANSKHTAAVEGSIHGQYDTGAKAMLKTAIDAAQAVANDAASKTQDEINSALAALNAVVANFDNAKINSETILFYESFDIRDPGNTYNAGPANSMGLVDDGNNAYYLNETIVVNGNNIPAEKWWPGASLKRGINFGPDAISNAGASPNFTITKINTTGQTDIKFQYSTLSWSVTEPIEVFYSINGGTSWSTTALAKPAPDYTHPYLYGRSWELLTYSLPKEAENVANLWIRIKSANTATDNTQIDDIKIFTARKEANPIVTFNVTDNSVDYSKPLKATADKELYRALDNSIVTNATDFFVLKENNSTGADVPFSATLAADKKTFTITPTQELDPASQYYIALKNRVVADASRVRALFTEKPFKTGADTMVLSTLVVEAQTLLATAVEGYNVGEYKIGSKKTLQDLLDISIAIMRNPESLRDAISLEEYVLDLSINDFKKAILTDDEPPIINIDETLSKVGIYPNPADSYIVISSVENARVVIYGISGATQIAINNYSGEPIDVSTLAAGEYFAIVNGNVYRFIKK